MTPYAEKKAQLLTKLAGAAGKAPSIGLAKPTSNLFRDRAPRTRPTVDLKHFDAVVKVDPAAQTVEAEGMIPYADLVDATLAHGVMPCVVPQLKSITLGGAVAGVGIEASSFKYGLVHETVLSLEVLTATGEVVTCTPHNEHRDLFFGFPNSYGTLGYALKVTARTLPVKPYVKLQHVRYNDARACFADIADHCAEQAVNFLDGTVFSGGDMYLTLGRFVDSAPYLSDYTFERIYYRSVRERSTDYLTTHDYIWRWDTDWFWCSKNVFAQQPLVRRLFGRAHLNSVIYQKIMRWNTRWGLTRNWNRLRGVHPESVIQDVDIPVERAPEFLEFLLREIGILPIWLCPIKSPHDGAPFPLYPLAGGVTHVNFGFWDVVQDRTEHPRGFYNRKIERKTEELGGIKSLYSDSYFDEDEFWTIYNREAYQALKRRYDPGNALRDLYAKCVVHA